VTIAILASTESTRAEGNLTVASYTVRFPSREADGYTFALFEFTNNGPETETLAGITFDPNSYDPDLPYGFWAPKGNQGYCQVTNSQNIPSGESCSIQFGYYSDPALFSDPGSGSAAVTFLSGARLDLTLSVLMKGDVNCDGIFSLLDPLADVQHLAGLRVSQVQPCPSVGNRFTTGLAGPAMGDVDCDFAVRQSDILSMLKYAAGLSVTLPDQCEPIGI
jgi:hypothetical protein